MSVRIVTDTNVNLPPEIIERFKIVLVPAIIIFGEEALKEGVEISTFEVIERLKSGFDFPKTSQPPPHDFESAYRSILAPDPSATILSLHLTGAQSGTVDSARKAAQIVRLEYPSSSIHVVDTQAFSIAQALIVIQAAEMVERGEPVNTILRRINKMGKNVDLFFILDSLDYVHKGGRLGRAAHLVGSLLSLKVILTFRDGELEPFATYRTMRHAMARLLKIAVETAEAAQSMQIAVGYVIHQTEAHLLANHIKERLAQEVRLFNEIGPALAVYTGPGAVGIALYPIHDPREVIA